jgi:hypothetical protein
LDGSNASSSADAGDAARVRQLEATLHAARSNAAEMAERSHRLSQKLRQAEQDLALMPGDLDPERQPRQGFTLVHFSAQP